MFSAKFMQITMRKLLYLVFDEFLIAKRKIEPGQLKTRHRVLICYCLEKENKLFG